MSLIRETIVTTADAAGVAHMAPLGLIAHGNGWIVAPFRPSKTLDNLRQVPFAVANYTDDVRIFAGCLTGPAAQVASQIQTISEKKSEGEAAPAA